MLKLRSLYIYLLCVTTGISVSSIISCTTQTQSEVVMSASEILADTIVTFKLDSVKLIFAYTDVKESCSDYLASNSSLEGFRELEYSMDSSLTDNVIAYTSPCKDTTKCKDDMYSAMSVIAFDLLSEKKAEILNMQTGEREKSYVMRSASQTLGGAKITFCLQNGHCFLTEIYL